MVTASSSHSAVVPISVTCLPTYVLGTAVASELDGQAAVTFRHPLCAQMIADTDTLGRTHSS
jgi:hypothetical protein